MRGFRGPEPGRRHRQLLLGGAQGGTYRHVATQPFCRLQAHGGARMH